MSIEHTCPGVWLQFQEWRGTHSDTFAASVRAANQKFRRDSGFTRSNIIVAAAIRLRISREQRDDDERGGENEVNQTCQHGLHVVGIGTWPRGIELKCIPGDLMAMAAVHQGQ